MPVFYGNPANPKELRGYYNAQKEIFKRTLAKSASSGVIGAPSADVDGFTKLLQQIEAVENQLEAYTPTVIKLVDTPERASAGNPADLFIALNALQKSLARATLSALPASSIQILKDYRDSLSAYQTSMSGFFDTIEASRADLFRLGLDPDVFGKTELDLAAIRDKLSIITQSITAQIAMYDSGVAQPIMGGGFDLDKPLRGLAMYDSPKYVLPRRFN
jgi:hypothetical protein